MAGPRQKRKQFVPPTGWTPPPPGWALQATHTSKCDRCPVHCTDDNPFKTCLGCGANVCWHCELKHGTLDHDCPSPWRPPVQSQAPGSTSTMLQSTMVQPTQIASNQQSSGAQVTSAPAGTTAGIEDPAPQEGSSIVDEQSAEPPTPELQSSHLETRPQTPARPPQHTAAGHATRLATSPTTAQHLRDDLNLQQVHTDDQAGISTVTYGVPNRPLPELQDTDMSPEDMSGSRGGGERRSALVRGMLQSSRRRHRQRNAGTERNVASESPLFVPSTEVNVPEGHSRISTRPLSGNQSRRKRTTREEVNDGNNEEQPSKRMRSDQQSTSHWVADTQEATTAVDDPSIAFGGRLSSGFSSHLARFPPQPGFSQRIAPPRRVSPGSIYGRTRTEVQRGVLLDMLLTAADALSAPREDRDIILDAFQTRSTDDRAAAPGLYDFDVLRGAAGLQAMRNTSSGAEAFQYAQRTMRDVLDGPDDETEEETSGPPVQRPVVERRRNDNRTRFVRNPSSSSRRPYVAPAQAYAVSSVRRDAMPQREVDQVVGGSGTVLHYPTGSRRNMSIDSVLNADERWAGSNI